MNADSKLRTVDETPNQYFKRLTRILCQKLLKDLEAAAVQYNDLHQTKQRLEGMGSDWHVDFGEDNISCFNFIKRC